VLRALGVSSLIMPPLSLVARSSSGPTRTEWSPSTIGQLIAYQRACRGRSSAKVRQPCNALTLGLATPVRSVE
jgi:hypothetical protein